jgi:hypothetical protein
MVIYSEPFLGRSPVLFNPTIPSRWTLRLHPVLDLHHPPLASRVDFAVILSVLAFHPYRRVLLILSPDIHFIDAMKLQNALLPLLIALYASGVSSTPLHKRDVPGNLVPEFGRSPPRAVYPHNISSPPMRQSLVVNISE